MMARRSHKSESRKSDKVRRPLDPAVNPLSSAGPPDRNVAREQSCELDPRFRLRKGTFTENLAGLQVEAVTDLNAPGYLALCVNDSATTEIRLSVEHQNITYVPGSILPGLGQIVRFPTMGSVAGSMDKLESEMKEFFSRYLDQDTHTLDLLIAFVFASWFAECFEVAPVLWLYGPDNEVSIALRLLNIFCYHSVLLSDVDLAALRTLPPGLRVTLLINETDLAPGVEKALLNSVRRHFCFARGAQPMDIFGARALHCHSPSQGIGLSVSVDPARHHLPCLTENDEQQQSHFFQERLLSYRMRHYSGVQDNEIDCDESYLGFHNEMKAWIGALPRGSDVKHSVINAFAERREESLSRRFEDPRCLVAEAALLFCHKDSVKHFYVGELGERVNDLLAGRHVHLKLEDRKIGSVLKNLGIHANRVTKGYRVTLTPKIRQRIHAVATAYRVLSTQPSVVRCDDCKKDQ